MANINETFKSRGDTHGDYKQQSECTMSLYRQLAERARVNKVSLNKTQQHSLMLICTKLGRIVTGSANEPDHWHDIAGYATLIERELNGLDYRTGEKKAKD